MAMCTTLSALSTPEITTSLTSTIAMLAQTKRAAIRTVTIKHRAHASISHTHAGIREYKKKGRSVV